MFDSRWQRSHQSRITLHFSSLGCSVPGWPYPHQFTSPCRASRREAARIATSAALSAVSSLIFLPACEYESWPCSDACCKNDTGIEPKALIDRWRDQLASNIHGGRMDFSPLGENRNRPAAARHSRPSTATRHASPDSRGPFRRPQLR